MIVHTKETYRLRERNERDKKRLNLIHQQFSAQQQRLHLVQRISQYLFDPIDVVMEHHVYSYIPPQKYKTLYRIIYLNLSSS